MNHWNEEAGIEMAKFMKAGYSASEARGITGHKSFDAMKSHSYVRRENSLKYYRQYLNVPFDKKNEVKELFKTFGFRLIWDPNQENIKTKKQGCWFIEVAYFFDTDRIKMYQLQTKEEFIHNIGLQQ